MVLEPFEVPAQTELEALKLKLVVNDGTFRVVDPGRVKRVVICTPINTSNKIINQQLLSSSSRTHTVTIDSIVPICSLQP